MQGVGEEGGGVAVSEVEELEGDALLVGSYAEGGEEEVNQARVAGALVVCWEVGGEGWMRWEGLWWWGWEGLRWCWGGDDGGAVGLWCLHVE